MASAPRASDLSDSTKRVPVLDGVRGLAVLTVAIFHFSILAHTPHTNWLDDAVYKVTSSGWMGVDLFLVLSGFLITGILYDTKYGQGYLRKFYARRVLRIFPVYYGFLLFMLSVTLVFSLDGPAVPSFTDDYGWYAVFLANVHVALDNAHGPDLPVTAILWSVSVEEQFYLVWPAIVLLLNRRMLIPVCVAAVVTAFVARLIMSNETHNVWLGYTLMPTRMDALAIGALIALLAREPGSLRQLARWAPVAGILMLAAVITLGIDFDSMYPFAPRIRTYGFTVIALMFGALIVTAVSVQATSPLSRFFSHEVMRALGRHSYAMYVVHYAVGYYIFSQVNIADKFLTIGGSHVLGQSVFVLVALAATFAVSWISWQLLETPFLRLKRYFAYDREDEERRVAPSIGAPALAGGD
jgi:peptidoglycan/LPS O-acetylase OafA/YrhL